MIAQRPFVSFHIFYFQKEEVWQMDPLIVDGLKLVPTL